MTDQDLTYNQLQLDTRADYKPLDFGGFGIMGSLNRDGKIIALNAVHPQYGYVTVTSARSFTETMRHSAIAVRNYRREMVSLEGFGLNFNSPIMQREVFLIEHAIPKMRLGLRGGLIAEVVTFVMAYGSQAFVIQKWNFETDQPFLRCHWRGTLSIQRSAYTQLTEGGPLSPPTIDTRWHHSVVHPKGLILENRNLHYQFYIGGLSMFDQTHPAIHKGRVHVTVPVTWDTSQELTFIYAISPSSSLPVEEPLSMSITAAFVSQTEIWQQRWQDYDFDDHPLDMIIRRGLVYAYFCSVPVYVDAICMLTDHMLLPLSWNRDSYYAAIALLHWNEAMYDIVRQHLIWLFEVAERTEQGYWGRSYITNGQIKDSQFQFDQQIYPLLELASYVLYTGDTETLDRLMPYVDPMIELLFKSQNPENWLFPTDETPGDDPIPHPYHLTSHILMWYMFAEFAKLDLNEEFVEMRDKIRQAIDHNFIAPHNGTPMYAYSTDGHGGFYFYHDANDIPLSLAPKWGFAANKDPVWLATIRFAFTEENEGGTYKGKLGSIHTPAPWSLGDVQELIIAQTLSEHEREKEVIQRLKRAAQWDGALPEAYNSETYKVISRNWFVWPNAMLYYIYT